MAIRDGSRRFPLPGRCEWIVHGGRSRASNLGAARAGSCGDRLDGAPAQRRLKNVKRLIGNRGSRVPEMTPGDVGRGFFFAIAVLHTEHAARCSTGRPWPRALLCSQVAQGLPLSQQTALVRSVQQTRRYASPDSPEPMRVPFLTTAPVATIASSPMVTSESTTACAPIVTLFPIRTG